MTNYQTTQTQKQMVELQLIVGPLTDGEINEVRQHTQSAAQDTTIPEKAIIDACIDLALGGLDRDQLQDMIHPVANYADQWDTDHEIVANYAACLHSCYGYDADGIADAFATTDTAVSDDVWAEEIIDVVKRVGPITAVINYPLTDVISDSEDLLAKGRLAEDVAEDLQSKYVAVGSTMSNIEGEHHE